LIISDATFREVADMAVARQLGTVTVKGRSTPTDIYQITSLSNV
jgi:class 3 adenylate cyclase